MQKIEGHHQTSEKLFEIRIWLSVSEAAEYCGISKSLLYKHGLYGIPCSTTTGKPGGKLLFNRYELDQWLGERRIS
jgi:hypothetical protein